MEVYLGTIMPWPIPFAPMGWALCNGQVLSVQQNQALFSLIGNYYGGSYPTNFALPDLRGRFPIGVNGDTTNGRVLCNLGQVGGQPTATLTANNIPQHVHQINNTVTGGGNVPVSMEIKIPANTDAYDATKVTNTPGSTCTLGVGKAGTSVTNIYSTSNPTAGANLKPFTVQSSINVPAQTVTSNCLPQPTTGAAFSIMPSFQAVYYIIAIEGYYPTRP